MWTDGTLADVDVSELSAETETEIERLEIWVWSYEGWGMMGLIAAMRASWQQVGKVF